MLLWIIKVIPVPKSPRFKLCLLCQIISGAPWEMVRFLDQAQMYKHSNLLLPAPVTNARLPLNEYDIISSIKYHFKQN